MGNRKLLWVKYLLLGGLVIWIFLVSGFYFLYHQGEVKNALLALSSWLLDLSLAVIMVTLAALWGGQLGRFLRLRHHSGWERFVFSAGLGYGLLATLVLLLGLSGLLYRWLLWLIVVLLAAAVWKEIKRLSGQARRWHTTIVNGLSLRLNFQTVLLFFLGANLLIAIFLASAPPTGWDALVVHLVVPKIALREHGLSPPVEIPNLFTQKPLLEHMLFTLGMALRGDRIAKLIAFSFSPLTVAALYAFGQRYSKPQVGLLAAVIFASTPVVVITSSVAYVDLGVTFYTFLSIYGLINRLKTHNRSWLVTCAIFGGWASQVKNNGLFVLVVLFLGIAYDLLRHRERWAEGVKSLLLLAAVVGLVIFPWLLSSMALSGQPSPAWTQLEAKAAVPSSPFAGLPRKALRIIVTPWEMTIVGAWANLPYGSTITPFFLLLLPLWFFIRPKEEAINPLILFSLVEFILWVANPIGPYPQSRLAMPIFPALSVISAYVFERLPSLDLPAFSLYKFFRLVLLLLLGLLLVAQVGHTAFYNPGPFLLGEETREGYLARILDQGISSGYYSALTHINEHLPEDARVGVVWPERRIYYCERICIPSPFQVDDTAEEMMVKVREMGLTHLLVSKRGQEFLLNSDFAMAENIPPRDRLVENLKTLLEEHFRLVHNEADSFLLYALEES